MTTWLPSIEVRDIGAGFEVLGPPEAFAQLADAFAGEVLSTEVTPDDGSVIAVRVADEGPVTMRHRGLNVEIVGGREALDLFADALRLLAAGPPTPSAVPYHVHLEPYPDHPWLADDSEPAVFG